MVKRDFGTILIFFIAGLATHRAILFLEKNNIFGFAKE